VKKLIPLLGFSILIVSLGFQNIAFAGNIACNPGQYIEGVMCLDCPAGSFCPDTVERFDCPPGTSSQSGAVECTPETNLPPIIDTNDVFVGGKIISIDATSLLLAATKSFSWMIPVVLSVIVIGIIVVKKSESS
jgi:hypothetical protein